MDYHLRSKGENVGVFQLQELHQRRLRGELDGTENIWRQDMANWELLDAVLAANGMTIPAPPPIPGSAAVASSASDSSRSKKSGRSILRGAIAAGVVLVILTSIMGVFVVHSLRGKRDRVAQEAATGPTTPGSASDSTEAGQIADKPIAVGTNTLTEADVQKRGREFRERQYLQAYQEHGTHKQAWDGDATQYFESWIAYYFGGATNLPDFRALGQKLADNPACDDPLVLVAIGGPINDANKKDALLRRALKGFEQSRYPAYPKLYAAIILADRSAARANLDQVALGYFKEMLNGGGLLPRDEPEVADTLINGWGKDFRKRQAANLYPLAAATKDFKWLGLVMEGEYHVDEAWKARGSGYANTVTAAGWKGFGTHLEQARKAFEKAWRSHPDRAIAPSRMISVSMGADGPEEMRLWFDRAIAAQIDYAPAWYYMRWGLRPRWHGDLDQMLALGARAVETKRFDADVPRKLFDVISDMEQEMKLAPGTHIYDNPKVWPHLKAMYEGYIAEPSQAKAAQGWRSTYATVAFLARHLDVCREQLQALNWKPTRESTTGWGRELSLLPLIVAGLTGPCSNEVKRAESRYQDQNLNEAADLCASLTELDKADDLTRKYAKARLASLRREQQLSKGEWIDLMPEGMEDPEWVIGGEKIKRLPDGAVEVAAGTAGHGFFSRTRAGANFEVKGEIEFVKSPNDSFQGGLIMGLPDNMDSEWFAFRLCRNAVNGSGASFGHRWGEPRGGRNFDVKEQRNTFQFKYENGKVNAWINDNQVFHDAKLPEPTTPLGSTSMVGLGAANEGQETVVRYRGVKIRKLQPGA